ncbi:TetR-like C-terminal domain-containing protein [Streptomyces malaysiensis]|uniref:TetR-like C-terminal domain-containing protein n=1 Tax=Streptomyces malaysiensis TaxID=92644 RepID=UPI002B2CC61D|nr:TetR-like C-terminal domain-containing protein [Streptomyces malaysiensis]
MIGSDAVDYRQRFRAIATSYVRFAATDAALLDLMFSTKNGNASEGLRAASERLFTAFGDLIDRGTAAGELRPRDPHRLRLLFAAIMQGIAALVGTRRISAEDGDSLIDDAISLLVHDRGPGEVAPPIR